MQDKKLNNAIQQALNIEKVMFGIDKFTVGGMDIIDIDANKLQDIARSNINVDLINNAYNVYKYRYSPFENNNLQFTSLTIKNDKYFRLLKFAMVRFKDNMPLPYSILECTHNTRNNLIPYTIKEILETLIKIKEHILYTYGIELNFANSFFKSLEVNCTFKHNQEFIDFSSSLLELGNWLSKTYPEKHQVNYDDDYIYIDTMYIKNNSLELKIYNKSKQLREAKEQDIEENYARIEYTLVDSSVVKYYFNTNKIADIGQDDIYNFIIRKITKDIYTKYKNNKDENIKICKRIIKKHYKSSNRYWFKNALSEIKQLHIDKRINGLSHSTIKNAYRNTINKPITTKQKQLISNKFQEDYYKFADDFFNIVAVDILKM